MLRRAATRRYSSRPAADLLSALHARITQLYLSQGDSPSSSASLASQELRWLTHDARARHTAGIISSWERELERTTSELVELRKPLAYILGTQPFHPIPLDLLVRPPTLIPRPETEHWISHLSSLLPPSSTPIKILDIGTGTGCIPLALAFSLKARGIDVRAIGVDLHPNALSLARENVQRCSLESSIKIIEADVFQEDFVARMKGEMGGTFDLVVSNPPYITRKDYESLPSSVKDWEDRGALVGEDEGGVDDGLVFYERITGIAKELLREEGGEGPVLALEVGMGQSKRVGEMVERQRMRSEVAKDQWEIERLVLGWRD